jgi:CRISPR-associated protein Cas2
MFVIITYDVQEKRVNKVRKLLKKYLKWTQNSVFEGEITEGKLNKCLSEISNKVDISYDSIYIYEVKNPRSIKKNIMGKDLNVDDMFL